MTDETSARSSKEHLYDEMLTMLQRIATIPIGSSIPGSEIESLIKRASRAAPETRAGNQPDPYVSGLAQAGIRAERDRRIIERHVRWHDEALRLLQQVNTGYEGEWPEIADFVRRTTARIEQSSSEKANEQANTPRFSPAIEAEGMTWWNACTEAERAHWLKKAGSAAPADAWQAFRTSSSEE